MIKTFVFIILFANILSVYNDPDYCRSKANNTCRFCQNSFKNTFMECQNLASVNNNNCFLSSDEICYVCENGYQFDDNYNCIPSDLKKDCALNIYDGTCYACRNNLVPNDDYECVSKEDGDDNYDPKCIVNTPEDTDNYNICYECESGYVYSFREEECIERKDSLTNCLFALNEDLCYICQQNYRMDNSHQCIKVQTSSVNEFFKHVKVTNTKTIKKIDLKKIKTKSFGLKNILRSN